MALAKMIGSDKEYSITDVFSSCWKNCLKKKSKDYENIEGVNLNGGNKTTGDSNKAFDNRENREYFLYLKRRQMRQI